MIPYFFKYIIYTICILLISSCSSDEIGDDQSSFVKYFGNSGLNDGADVKALSDGNYLVFGTVTTRDSGKDLYLIKINNVGNTIWKKYYGGRNDEKAYNMQLCNDGGYILAGSSVVNISQTKSISSVYVVRTNTEGDTLWTKYIYENTSITPLNIYVRNDNGFVIAGSIEETNNATEAMLIFLDTNGNMEKPILKIDQTFKDARGVVQNGDNFVFICSTISNAPGTIGSSDIIAGITSGKNSLSMSVNLGTSNADLGQSIKKLTDTTFLCLGNITTADSGQQIFLTKIKTDENNGFVTLWEKKFGTSGTDNGTCFDLMSNSNIIVAGNFTSADGNEDMEFFILDQNGNLLSSAIKGGTGNQSVNAIAVTKDNGFIVCGSNEYSGSSVISVLKFSSLRDF